ncbi:putative diphosphate--fructose-6-phosphate 1-phosphotransferase [Dioscorea sansibarensis]
MGFGGAMEMSPLQKQRSLYRPELPPCLHGSKIHIEFGDATTVADPLDALSIQRSFPHTYGQPLVHFAHSSSATLPVAHGVKQKSPIRIGVVFCGRQSPGGHNVICGIRDAMKLHNPESTLIGFCGGCSSVFFDYCS